jgi:hypothetical protein
MKTVRTVRRNPLTVEQMQERARNLVAEIHSCRCACTACRVGSCADCENDGTAQNCAKWELADDEPRAKGVGLIGRPNSFRHPDAVRCQRAQDDAVEHQVAGARLQARRAKQWMH